MNELAPYQAPLFPEMEGRELLTIDEDRRAGRFTAERVARNQAKYRAICQALAEGLGVRMIARAFGVSPHVIQLIREKEAADIATQKQVVATKIGRLQHLALERLEELLLDKYSKLTAFELSVLVEKLSDKWLLLSGEATSRIVVQSGQAERVRALLEAELREAIDVPARVTSDSRSDAGTPKAEQMPAPAPAGVTVGVNDAPASPPAPAPAPAPAAAPGGAGVARERGGGQTDQLMEPEKFSGNGPSEENRP